MAKRKELGRIFFPGNPWPKGHAVTRFEWTARLERSSGIWFDLHLETANYYAEDQPAHSDIDEDETLSDWESKIVWRNYHSCTISSTYWEDSFGFLAGSKAEPLDFARIGKRTFAFDDNPHDLFPPRPFRIYLTGHDAVSSHRVIFRREPSKKTYTVSWSGRIAQEYIGGTEFKHEFDAKVKGVRFGGIVLPALSHRQDALSQLRPFVTDLRAYKARRLKVGWLVMPK